jgi:hypothetical protein
VSSIAKEYNIYCRIPGFVESYNDYYYKGYGCDSYEENFKFIEKIIPIINILYFLCDNNIINTKIYEIITSDNKKEMLKNNIELLHYYYDVQIVDFDELEEFEEEILKWLND